MSKINDGGPAFPTDNEWYAGISSYHKEGMTLRDYFAAAALQGAIATGDTDDVTEADLAQYAYRQADAMLAERERDHD